MLNSITPYQIIDKSQQINKLNPLSEDDRKTSKYQHEANYSILEESRGAKNTALVNNIMLEKILENQEKLNRLLSMNLYKK